MHKKWEKIENFTESPRMQTINNSQAYLIEKTVNYNSINRAKNINFH